MYQKSTGSTRKFVYEIDMVCQETIIELKNIQCKYHIMKFDKCDNSIEDDLDEQVVEDNNENNENTNAYVSVKGYIYFGNARNICGIKTLLNIDNVKPSNISHNEVLLRYKLGDYWENSIIPKQGRKKEAMVAQPEEIVITNKLMNETIIHLLKQSIEMHNDSNSVGKQHNDLLNVFIESNRLLQEEIKELKQTQVITVSNNSNNIIEKVENNKTFNINVFLNEECKNAISLKEFVEMIEIQESDLFYAKNNGLVEAITNIFQRELLNYEVKKRPVHCTDVKREVLHIKEDEGWVKESAQDSTRFQRAITYIADKKIQKLSEYVEKHPEMKNVRSAGYEEGLKMMIGIMGGTEHPNIMKKKVQKNIAKVVYLAKG